MVYKCKICGGSVTVDSKSRVATCDYCGTKQVLPLFSDDSSIRLYDSGNNYLQHSEYDKAENVFNQLLTIAPEESEIYWNLVLCKYGVTFVCDPQTQKYIPTCNRTHFESILNDSNYQNALKYSNDEKSAYYKETAETINNIQKGIISISKKEKPFDIFISYKETDSDGNRTKDSVKAQELYEKLTGEGYKVFFSRITLEDKIGSEYEPYIYAALSSSKIMLTVSSSRENLEAPWVKNEWSRFLTLRQSDPSKSLIPLYFDMKKSDFPEEFAILSSQNMNVEGFDQELIRGIKKLIPKPIMLAIKRKKLKKKLTIAGMFVIILVLLGGIASIPWLMKIPDYNNAMQLYYEQKYPEATWAFADLGKYRNSAEMKDICEQSWRNSLAITITDMLDGAKKDGTYYIDENGNVCALEGSALNSNLTVNEHGKVASLAFYNKRNVIYDDGYVSNISNSFSDKGEWHNIVQLSPNFDYTTVALRADGTMLYGVLVDDDEYPNHELTSNEWMKPIKNWNNIVSFTWGVDSAVGCATDGYWYTDAYIIGLKADGNVEIVKSTGMSFSLSKAEAKEYINGKEYCASTSSTDTLNPPQRYVLDNSGTLLKASTNMPVLKDILINIADRYAVSKNGNVYDIPSEFDSGDPVLIDRIKVRTYKEWDLSKANYDTVTLAVKVSAPQTTTAKTTQRKKVTVSENRLDKSFLGVPVGGSEDNKRMIKRIFVKPVIKGGNAKKTAETNEYIDNFYNEIISSFTENQGIAEYEIKYRYISYKNIGFFIFDELYMGGGVDISCRMITFDEYTGEKLSNSDIVSRLGLSKSKILSDVKNDYGDLNSLNNNDKVYKAMCKDDEWEIDSYKWADNELNLSCETDYIESFDNLKLYVDNGNLKCLLYYYEEIVNVYVEHTLGKISEFKS